MPEQLFLELRDALAHRNMDKVNRIHNGLLSIKSGHNLVESFWKLRIEAEIYHFKRDYPQASSLLKRAQKIVTKLSLTDSQLGSLNGRYASCLYNTANYEEALNFYSTAKLLAHNDIPRSYYYKTKILQCLIKLEKKTEFFDFFEETLNSLTSDPLKKVWDHHLNYLWNLVSIFRRNSWFSEIKQYISNYIPEKTKDYTLSFLQFISALISRSEHKYDEMCGHIELCLKYFQDSWDPVDHKNLLLNCASLVRYPFSDFQTAKKYLEQALILSPNPDGWRIHILNSLGSVLRFTGEYSRAVQVLKESINLSVLPKNLWQLGFAYNTLGMIYTLLGRNSLAKDAFDSSLECNIEESNDTGKGYTYGSMGWRESVLGNFKEAEKYYTKSIASFGKFGYIPPIIYLAKAEILSNISVSTSSEIDGLLKKAHEIIWNRNLRLDKGRYFITLGNISFNYKEYPKAEESFLKALYFEDIYEVYSQALLGTIKVNASLYVKNEDNKYLNRVRTHLTSLKTISHRNSLLWAEMNLISAIIDMSEGDLVHASESLSVIRSYSESHQLSDLFSRLEKQENNLKIYQRYNKLQDQIKDFSEREYLKSQSLKDMMHYLKTISRLLSAYSSDTKLDKQ